MKKFEVIVLKKSVVVSSTEFENEVDAQHHFGQEVLAISEEAFHANEDPTEGANAVYVDGFSVILATYH